MIKSFIALYKKRDYEWYHKMKAQFKELVEGGKISLTEISNFIGHSLEAVSQVSNVSST